MPRLSIFATADEASAARRHAGDLRISGFSVVCYVIHRCDPSDVGIALEGLPLISGKETYASKLRSDSGLSYSVGQLVDSSILESLEAAFRSEFLPNGDSPLTQNLVWIRESPVILSVLPLRFQVPALRTASGRDLDFEPNYYLTDALDVQQLIQLLRELTSQANLESIKVGTSESLNTLQIRTDSSMPTDSVIGLDLWSLAGTVSRGEGAMFSAALDCARHSWPLSALLNYPSDHIGDGLFQSMSHEAVYEQMSHAFGFMDDHAVFANSSCCLEVTHFGDWTPRRSHTRIREYGFDSSSIYLWGLALARSESYRSIADEYGRHIHTLTQPVSSTSVDESRLLDQCMRSLRLIDTLQSLHLAMREERSRNVDRMFREVFSDDLREEAARSRLDATRQLLIERRDRSEERAEQVGVTRLTLAATLVALAAVPGLVAQLWEWSDDQRWDPVGVTVVLVIVAVGVMWLALGTRRTPATGNPESLTDDRP